MKNVVGLQTDDAGNVGQKSSAHVACVVGLQTDAVVLTETRFSECNFHKIDQNHRFSRLWGGEVFMIYYINLTKIVRLAATFDNFSIDRTNSI